jgi:hypothetical protein
VPGLGVQGVPQPPPPELQTQDIEIQGPNRGINFVADFLTGFGGGPGAATQQQAQRSAQTERLFGAQQGQVDLQTQLVQQQELNRRANVGLDLESKRFGLAEKKESRLAAQGDIQLLNLGNGSFGIVSKLSLSQLQPGQDPLQSGAVSIFQIDPSQSFDSLLKSAKEGGIRFNKNELSNLRLAHKANGVDGFARRFNDIQDDRSTESRFKRTLEVRAPEANQDVIQGLVQRVITGQMTIQQAKGQVVGSKQKQALAAELVKSPSLLLPPRVRDAITSLGTASNLVDMLERMANDVVAAPDTKEKIARSILLEGFIDGIASILSRGIFQEKGVLREEDIQRAKSLLPGWKAANFAPGFISREIAVLRAIIDNGQNTLLQEGFKKFPSGGQPATTDKPKPTHKFVDGKIVPVS